MKGLKPKIAFEVRKDNCMTFENAARVALRIKAAFNGSHCNASKPMGTEPTPMELGKLEMKPMKREKKKLTDEEYFLVRGKSCFVCKKGLPILEPRCQTSSKLHQCAPGEFDFYIVLIIFLLGKPKCSPPYKTTGGTGHVVMY